MHNKEQKLQEKFISLLKEKIPGRLANTLLDILPLEKEAIYRRLRGDVPFTFFEMATLAEHLGISLDNIANIISPYRSQCYMLHVRDYNEFNAIDLHMSHSYVNAINMAADNPYSEFGIAANMLPLHISLLHPSIYRIYLLKWRYQFGQINKSQLSYSTTHVPEKEQETYHLYLEAIKRIKHTFFIWDSSFFISLINDINYFYKVRMITKDEMYMLKGEMASLLKTLEYYVDQGKFEPNGNKIDTYISTLNFDTTYSYLISDNISISMSTAYSLGAFTSLEREACEETKKWVDGLKKSSYLISGVAQQHKILFFEEQREILKNKLSGNNP